MPLDAPSKPAVLSIAERAKLAEKRYAMGPRLLALMRISEHGTDRSVVVPRRSKKRLKIDYGVDF